MRFLNSERYMDYSLLLGIRKIDQPDQEDSNKLKSMDLEQFDGNTQRNSDEDESLKKTLKAIQNDRTSTGKIDFFISNNEKWIYQVSVIDYLQTFDGSKKREVMAKRVFKNVNVTNLSAVPPDPYFQRWIKFVEDRVFVSSMMDEKMKRSEDTDKTLKEINDHIK